MKKENRKQKKGISLIALIITIIVIVLLAAIVVNTAITTPQSASFAKFASDMGELQQAVTLTYFDIYATEAVKASPRTNAEIYEEIAKGTEATSTQYPSSLPAGIDGNIAWKVNDATRLSSIETLPDGDFYITDKGVIFSAGGYENNGEIFLTASVKVGDIITSTYNEDEGVNAPALVNNLIPVYYDGGWKKADSTNPSNQWYQYNTSNKKWANAVTVNENKRGTYSVGDLIPEADIIGMFVWIPRYAYQITGTGTIGIKFLKGTTDTCTDDTEALRNGKTELNYVVHPAFTNGANTNYKNGEWNKEITGFWVAKFEASSNEATSDCTFDINGNLTTIENSDADRKIGDTCGRAGNTTENITVRPNVTSWRRILAKDIYTKCEDMGSHHGLSSVLQSHMMKNSEWGAVAYLTQSDYGYNAGGNKILNNSYYEGDSYYGTLTGMVGETAIDDSTLNTLVKSTRSINLDGTVIITYTNSTSKTFYRYNTENGVKGSTTGNIYGIYDMSGGAWDYMSSYVANDLGNITSYAPETTNYSLLQIYESTVSNGTDSRSTDYELAGRNGIYGDAVYETSSTYLGGNSWNGDYSIFPSLGGIFFARGGAFNAGSYAGVFAFSNVTGAGRNSGFRPVLSAL